MNTNIQFPQGPITGPDGYITLEWQQWLQNPQFITINFAGVLGVASGGTGIGLGVSGGVLGFTDTDVIASSALLTNHALVVGGGAGATPSALGSLGTATTVLHGNAAGNPTFGAVSLTADVSGTLAISNGGTGVTTASANTVFAGPVSGVGSAPSFRALVPADLSMTPIANSLSADVALNNIANYFTGPIIAQGTTGKWFVSGTVTVLAAAGDSILAKLWDGTTVIDSALSGCAGNGAVAISLSGFITSPAADLRISVRNSTGAAGNIKFNATGESKDSTITALRVG